MPANLNEPFSPSCCDGGETGNDRSARPCGCDPGANWVCQRHQEEEVIATLRARPYTTFLEVRQPDGSHVVCELALTPIGFSDIRQPDSWWMQLLANLVKRPQDTNLLRELDSLQEVRLNEQKS